jgi:putative endonuclease
MVSDGAGRSAERLAAAFLERQGLKLLAHNYRCRFGEVDLVLRDGNTLVFAEVRLRSSTAFGGAGASVTLAKQRKIVKAAQHYLGGRGDAMPCRFDAVLLNDLRGVEVEWIKNAFGA